MIVKGRVHSERSLFLFNDILLVTKFKRRKNKYHVEAILPLYKMIVDDYREDRHLFKITVRDNSSNKVLIISSQHHVISGTASHPNSNPSSSPNSNNNSEESEPDSCDIDDTGNNVNNSNDDSDSSSNENGNNSPTGNSTTLHNIEERTEGRSQSR